MFAYAMIAAELVLVYLTFWYLFLRDPEPRRKIAANTWGCYQKPIRTECNAVTEHKSTQQGHSECTAGHHGHPAEMIFDPRNNKYISIKQFNQTQSSVALVLQRIDEFLSRLNVRP